MHCEPRKPYHYACYYKDKGMARDNAIEIPG